MKKYLGLLSLSLVWITGCEKAANDVTCAKGTIHFTNESIYKYEIFVDDESVSTVDKKANYDHQLYAGRYFVKIVQASGFKVDPRVTEQWVTLEGCGDTEDVIIKRIAADTLDK